MNKNTEVLYNQIKDIVNQYKYIGDDDIIVVLACYLLKVAKEEFVRPDTISYDELICMDKHRKLLLDEPIAKFITNEMWEKLKLLVNYVSLNDLYSMVLFVNSKINTYNKNPKEINKLLSSIAKIHDGDNICYINSDAIGFIDDNIKEVAGHKIYCIEVDKNKHIILMIIANMIRVDLEIIEDEMMAISNEYLGKFDTVFVDMLHFTVQLRNDSIEEVFRIKDYFYRRGINKSNISGLGYVLMITDLISYNGKIIIILPSGHLMNSSDRNVRKYLVENQLVECVITLPANLFSYSSINMNILVISHNNSYVRMVDASKYFTSGRRINKLSSENIQTILDAVHGKNNYKDVLKEDIINNDYSFLPKKYIEDAPKFNSGIEFDSIIKDIRRGIPFTASRLDEIISEDETEYQYLSMANFYNINQDLPYIKYIDKIEKYCAFKNDIIISKNGMPVKVAVVPKLKNNKHIVVNGNIYIIKLREELVNPYYLKAFFESEIGNKLLSNITAGTSISIISVESLKRLIIPLPPIEEQNAIAERYKTISNEIDDLYSLIKEKEEQRSSLISKINKYNF